MQETLVYFYKPTKRVEVFSIPATDEERRLLRLCDGHYLGESHPLNIHNALVTLSDWVMDDKPATMVTNDIGLGKWRQFLSRQSTEGPTFVSGVNLY